MPTPDGSLIMHVEMKVGDSIFFLCDPMGLDCSVPKGTPTRVGLHLYVEDPDAAYKQAVSADCEATMPLMDAFWGDRFGQVKDPYGHTWSIAAHIADPTPEEIQQGAIEFFKNCAQ